MSLLCCYDELEFSVLVVITAHMIFQGMELLFQSFLVLYKMLSKVEICHSAQKF